MRATRNPKFSFIGDARTVLEDLLEYQKEHPITLKIDEWRQRATNLKKKFVLDYNRESEHIQSAEVMDHLSSHITQNTIFTTGVGNHQMFAAQYLKTLRPHSFLTSGAFGTMGFSLPSSIGAHYANPDAVVIAIDGDSSIKMNMGEIHTIGSLGLPIKVLLLNNHGDGMIRGIQTAMYEKQYTGSERAFDAHFANIAKECGFTWTKKISKHEELEPSLNEFLAAEGPCFLEVVIDRDEAVYPLIPIGKGYKDMILGPYIKESAVWK